MAKNDVTLELGKQSELGQIIYRKGDGQLFTHSFSVNVTNLCPSSCAFCIRNMSDGWNAGDNLWLRREPSIDELVAATEDALRVASNGERLLKVRICGYGEPLLFPDRVARVASTVKAFDPKIIVQVISLGWPLYYELEQSDDRMTFTRRRGGETTELISKLKVAGVDWISVSVNAPTKESYIKVVRPVKVAEQESYAQVWSFLEEAKSAGFKVTSTMVAMPTMAQADIDGLEQRLAGMAVPLKVRGLVRNRGGGRRAKELALKLSNTVA